jgi:hypothetical protein
MSKATYDPDLDSRIALAQLYSDVAGTADITTHASSTNTHIGGAGTVLSVAAATGYYFLMNRENTGVLYYDTGATPIFYATVTFNTWSSPQTLGSTSTRSYSIYCTYTPAAGGWTKIAKVGGIAATTMAKVNGIAVASIAKLNGVAV